MEDILIKIDKIFLLEIMILFFLFIGKIYIWFLMLILMIVNNCRINEFFIFVGIGYLFEVFDRVWVLINSVREDSYFVLKIEDEGFIILIFD